VLLYCKANGEVMKNRIEDYCHELTKIEIVSDIVDLMLENPLGITIKALSRYYDYSETKTRTMINDLIKGNVLVKTHSSSETYYWPKELMEHFPNTERISAFQLETLISLDLSQKEQNGEQVDLDSIFKNSVDLTKSKLSEKLKKLEMVDFRLVKRTGQGKDVTYGLTKRGKECLDYIKYYPHIAEDMGVDSKQYNKEEE
jgi:predicted transcriptional regulator